MLCAVIGDNEHWEKYSAEAQNMRAAMMDYLFNDDTGAFVLNYDQEGNYQDNFTADEIFPVLFGIADEKQRRAILERLAEADFVTPVGLRTISTADAWYFPSYGFGLLGGIWPDLTLWYAVALARNDMCDEAVRFLCLTYAAMEGGSPRNTVPGEFAEWFDGGSLSNRGMYLSPWTSAKYLWAVAETVGGLNGYRTSGRPHLAPLRPTNWQWIAAARVHWGGRRCTYVIDLRGNTIYGNMPELSAEEPFTCIYAGRDVSDEVSTSPVEVGAVAFEDEGARCGSSSATIWTAHATCCSSFAGIRHEWIWRRASCARYTSSVSRATVARVRPNSTSSGRSFAREISDARFGRRRHRAPLGRCGRTADGRPCDAPGDRAAAAIDYSDAATLGRR